MRQPRWLEEPPNPLARRFKRLGLLLFVAVAIWNVFSFVEYTDTAAQLANNQLANEQLANDLLADDLLTNDDLGYDRLANDDLLGYDRLANDDPVNDVPVNDEPVNDELVNDVPVNDVPLNDEPAIDEPLNDEPVNHEPANDEPVNHEPVNHKPVNHEPVNHKPVNHKPVNHKPVNDDANLDDVDETGLSGYDRSLNLEFCGRKVCKWLFVYSQGEQESRANKWFRVWNWAAKQMKRVVVLPHVGSSHIRSCMSKPFDFYYDIEDMERRYPGVTFVHQDRFVEWATRRRQVATMRWMSIEIDHKLSLAKKELGWSYRPLDMRWVKKRSCMKGLPLETDPSPLNMTYVTLPDRWWRTMRNKIRADILTSIRASDADVLMVTHGNVNPDIWPGSDTEPLKYASHIYEAANSLTEKFLRPFVAVHWRMENSTYEDLPECAEQMVDWLPKYAAERGLDHIYIATDYPIMGGSNAQSTSWHKLPKPSTQAFEVIKNSLPFETWMTVLDKYSREDDNQDLSELKDGVQSIIDKLVAENADYFVTPPEACRKPYSNWTRAVVRERKKKAQAKDPNVKNVVDEFPTPKSLSGRALR